MPIHDRGNILEVATTTHFERVEPEDIAILEELFAKSIECEDSATHSLSTRQMVQLQGQIEESLDLLNDAVEELREIDPQAVTTIKLLTLKIFDAQQSLN